jgi:hypothetical protein
MLQPLLKSLLKEPLPGSVPADTPGGTPGETPDDTSGENGGTPEPATPLVDLDFRSLSAWPEGFTHSRGTGGYLRNASDNAWLSFGPDDPLIVPGRGWYFPGPFTQYLGNNLFAGAAAGVVGSGGALPTGWLFRTDAALSVEVIEVDGSKGPDSFITVRIAGGGSGTYGMLEMIPSAVQGLGAAAYTGSMRYLRTSAGDDAEIMLRVRRGFGPGSETLLPPTAVPTPITSTFIFDRTGWLNFNLQLLPAGGFAGKTIDETITIRCPQVVEGTAAQSLAVMGTDGAGVLSSNAEVANRALSMPPPFTLTAQARCPAAAGGLKQDPYLWDWSGAPGSRAGLSLLRTSGALSAFIEVAGGGRVAVSPGTPAPGATFAAAFAVQTDGVAAAMNGGAVSSAAVADPGTLSALTLGRSSSAAPWWQWVERLVIRADAASDPELTAASVAQ